MSHGVAILLLYRREVALRSLDGIGHEVTLAEVERSEAIARSAMRDAGILAIVLARNRLPKGEFCGA